MKKLVIAAALFSSLATGAFAGTNSDDDKKMRHEFMMHTQQMIDAEMAMLKNMEAMLSSYQRLLENMMRADGGDKQ